MTEKPPSLTVNLMDMEITAEEIEALKIMAKAATGGQWMHRKDGRPDLNNQNNIVESTKLTRLVTGDLCETLISYGQMTDEDAAYIAAAQPLMMLRLIASYESAHRYLDRAKRALERSGFQDLGGAEWKPPIGKPPVFVPVPMDDAAVKDASRYRDMRRMYCTDTGMATEDFDRMMDSDIASYQPKVRPGPSMPSELWDDPEVRNMFYQSARTALAEVALDLSNKERELFLVAIQVVWAEMALQLLGPDYMMGVYSAAIQDLEGSAPAQVH